MAPFLPDRLGLEHGRSSPRARPPPRAASSRAPPASELVAEHLRRRARRGSSSRRRPLADEAPVAQHRHAVGDLVDLVEEVRDEHDRDSLRRELTDHREELVDLALVEARRRLVEDQHLGRDVDRARDGHHLLHGERVAGRASADTSTWTSTRSSASAALRRIARHWMLPEAARLAADVDVLGDREVGAEVDLLVDGADAGMLRLERAGEEHRAALELDRARVDVVARR